MTFKYKTKFTSSADLNFGKWREAQASNTVFANYDLSDLRKLLPSDEEIEENPDLLYNVLNAAVINLINANDHGMTTDTALAISKYFVNRPMNLEHDKWEIVGHVISYGFSSFGENKVLDPETLKGTKDPFNLALGSVVYKVAREYVAQYLADTANPSSCDYHRISASWEVGYNEFDIAIGSKKLTDAEIITDEAQIKEFAKYLRMEGGAGFTDDGVPVYCVIKGDARPLGCAYTGNPAAPVKGVFVASQGGDNSPVETDKIILEQITLSQNSIASLSEKLNSIDSDIKLLKNNSQSKETTVINYNMKKIKSIDEITPEFLHEAEASSVIKNFIGDEVLKGAQEYLDQVAEAKAEKQEAETQLAQANSEVERLTKEVEKLQGDIAKRDKDALFASRMEEVASAFALSDEQREAVASDIADLDDDAFAKYKTKLSLFASKPSEPVTTASEADDVTNLKNATASKVNIPNSQSETDKPENWVNKLTKAITISKQ